VGAIADGLAVIPMLFPDMGGFLFGISNFNPGIEYRYAMGVGASLMLGWAFLLIWADRQPAERKGVLLLTVFPVLFGGSNSWNIRSHLQPYYNRENGASLDIPGDSGCTIYL